MGVRGGLPGPGCREGRVACATRRRETATTAPAGRRRTRVTVAPGRPSWVGLVPKHAFCSCHGALSTSHRIWNKAQGSENAFLLTRNLDSGTQPSRVLAPSWERRIWKSPTLSFRFSVLSPRPGAQVTAPRSRTTAWGSWTRVLLSVPLAAVEANRVRLVGQLRTLTRSARATAKRWKRSVVTRRRSCYTLRQYRKRFSTERRRQLARDRMFVTE